MDPSGGYSIHYCEFVENGLGLGGFGDGLAVLGAGVSLVNSGVSVVSLHQSMSSSASELFAEVNAASGGPGGWVLRNGEPVWDPNATPDTPGFLEPFVMHDLGDGNYFYFTPSSIKSNAIKWDLASVEIPFEKPWYEKLSIAGIGHAVLDVVGAIPIVGVVADLANAVWYAAEGDLILAGMSMVAAGGGSSAIIAMKYGGMAVAKTAIAVSTKAAAAKIILKNSGVAEQVAKQAEKEVGGKLAEQGAKEILETEAKAGAAVVDDVAEGSLDVAAKGATSSLQLRPDIVLSGGRSGQLVKNLTGPANSVLKGSGNRIFITDDAGRVIWDITKDRAKPVIPGQGFGPKVAPTQEQLNLLIQLLGN